MEFLTDLIAELDDDPEGIGEVLRALSDWVGDFSDECDDRDDADKIIEAKHDLYRLAGVLEDLVTDECESDD